MSATWQWAKANPDAAARRIRELERENAALREKFMFAESEIILLREDREEFRADKDRLDWIIGKAHYLFFKDLGSDLAKGREQIDAARKEAQP